MDVKSIAKLTPEEVLTSESSTVNEMLKKIPMIKKVCAAIETRAKQILTDDPHGLDDYKLGKPIFTRTITDSSKAIERVLSIESKGETAITPPDLLSISKFPVVALENLIRTKRKLTVNESKDFMAEVLGDILVDKEQARRLVIKKK